MRTLSTFSRGTTLFIYLEHLTVPGDVTSASSLAAFKNRLETNLQFLFRRRYDIL